MAHMPNPRNNKYFFQAKGMRLLPFKNPYTNDFAEETISVDMRCVDWADAERKSKFALESILQQGFCKTTREIWYCDEYGRKVFATLTDFVNREEKLLINN